MSVSFDVRVPATLESCNSVIIRPTQHLKTQDSYTPLWEASRQKRGVACAEGIPYLAIDRGENDWQREQEVSEPTSALRACLVTKMAEALHDSATKQVSDILELLQTGEYCNTFSERGKWQTQELQQFKDADPSLTATDP